MTLVEKYLLNYAEPTLSLAEKLDQEWQQVICIPAYDEAELLPGLIERLAQEAGLLCILVCNSPDTPLAAEAERRTRQMATTLRRRYSDCRSLDQRASLLRLNQSGSDLLLLERYGLPANQGVGLARKIACDLACRLIASGRVQSRWIHNTDADTSLPADYFQIEPETSAAAAMYPFRHEPNPDPVLQQGLQAYDYGLHYYLAGLRWANSPYAFYTIGSTLLINHLHYAMARGFPKRSGGEDFYLLNKLAKLGRIQSLQSMPLRLSGRASKRAPFGTGAAVSRFSQSDARQTDYPYYHPRCFTALKHFLQLLPALSRPGRWQDIFVDELLVLCLEKLGLEKAIEHARRHGSTPERFLKHLHDWFDAFRTLRLIHLLRDHGLSSLHYADLQKLKNDYAFIEAANQLAAPVY